MGDQAIVVLISANSEWQAVKSILTPGAVTPSQMGESFLSKGLTYFHGGWGKVSAAATTQYVIDQFKPDLLVNLGTCGGIEGRIESGSIILVTRTIIYDIFEKMSDPEAAIAEYTTELDLAWLPKPLPHPVISGPLVSADRDLAAEELRDLIHKYGAIAADWESGAIAWVTKRNGKRCLILRGVTDLVSPSGGEAYGKIELFHKNTHIIMQKLIQEIPDWLGQAG